MTLHCIGAGVLGLVDQDVIEAAVELVEHPFGAGACGEQPGREADKIVEVERRAASLERGVALQHRLGEPHQRHGGLDHREMDALSTKRHERRLRRRQVSRDIGMRGAQCRW